MERLQILESKVEEADYAYKEAAKNYKDKMSSVRDSDCLQRYQRCSHMGETSSQ